MPNCSTYLFSFQRTPEADGLRTPTPSYVRPSLGGAIYGFSPGGQVFCCRAFTSDFNELLGFNGVDDSLLHRSARISCRRGSSSDHGRERRARLSRRRLPATSASRRVDAPRNPAPQLGNPAHRPIGPLHPPARNRWRGDRLFSGLPLRSGRPAVATDSRRLKTASGPHRPEAQTPLPSASAHRSKTTATIKRSPHGELTQLPTAAAKRQPRQNAQRAVNLRIYPLPRQNDRRGKPTTVR